MHTRHISATRTTNKRTGERRYFLDGKRVTYEAYAMCAIAATRTSCFSSDETRTVTRNHSLVTHADGAADLTELLDRVEDINREDGFTGDRQVCAEMFGHYCAMQAMGHGVGLYDAFGSAVHEAIRVPYVEFGSHSLERDYF